MPFRVGVATRAEWIAAARVLFSHLPDPTDPANRLLTLIREADLESEGLIVATDEAGAVVAAVLAVVQPGAQGQLLPPSSATPEIEDRLVAEACRWLKSRGVKLVQANLAEGEQKRGNSLLRAGFQQITLLIHFGVATDGVISKNESGFVLRPYAEIDPQRFADTLISSYTDTHDCPELDGVRTPDEIVAGYRGAVGRMPLWFQAETDGEPAGVLLLASGDSPFEREIAYLGIVPKFRQRGLGKALTRAAICIAGESGAERLTLGVDIRNEPAIRMYEREGFLRNCRSLVYLKIGPG